MPGLFDGVIGNGATLRRLRAGLQAERAGPLRCHAYLVTGPVAVGKRTLATAMGAALVCQSTDTPAVPCGACRACRLVERGTHPDVRLVEAESGKRGVSIEQVRQLEHDVVLRPYEASRKAFVVSDVETMSDAAANALLKTLEEPPADTVLILTASDVSQVLPTIVSRCREVALRSVPAAETEAGLIARGVDAQQARTLARLAAGRPGWAIGAAADPARVEAHVGQVERLEGLLAQRRTDRLSAAAGFHDVASTKEVLDAWLGWWRDALLVQQALPELVTHTDRVDRLNRLGAAHPPEVVWLALRRIQEARQQLDANVNLRLAVETLLLDLPDPAGAPS